MGSVCPRCRDAAAGWARAASGAGNRWAAVVAAVRRRGGGRSLGGRSLWSVAFCVYSVYHTEHRNG